MKTDREFLEGIYEKARLLEAERKETENSVFEKGQTDREEKLIKIKETEKMLQLPLPKRNAIPIRGIAAAAAAFAVVITGSLYFNRSVPMEIPQGYQELTQTQEANEADGIANFRAAPAASPMMVTASSPVVDAQVICTAKVGRIEKSIYDEETSTFTTTIQLKPIEIIKGQPASPISLTVAGGYDEKAKTYQEYEEVFEVNERVLLFLEEAQPADEVGKSSYVLLESAGGKYTPIENGEDGYQDELGTVYSIDAIKAEVAALPGFCGNSADRGNPAADIEE